MPFKLNQFDRTICGRGYSANGLLVSTCCAKSVMSGACFICHARAGSEKPSAAARSANWNILWIIIVMMQGFHLTQPRRASANSLRGGLSELAAALCYAG
jgi:hypothetical protein